MTKSKVIIAVLMGLLLSTMAQVPVEDAEPIELHDDLPNPSDSEDGDDPLAGLPEEEKKKYYEMQQIMTAGSILYAQIYFNTYGETTVKAIFEAMDKSHHANLFKKLTVVLIKHCLKTAKGPDMIEVGVSDSVNRQRKQGQLRYQFVGPSERHRFVGIRLLCP